MHQVTPHIARLPAFTRSVCLVALGMLLAACSATTPAPPQEASARGRDTRDAAALFATGQDAAERGDAIRAEQYLALALDHGYDRDVVTPLLLKVCIAGSHLRAALNHAEPYLRQHPEDERLRFLVATIHLGLEQRDEARSNLEQLLRENSEYADAHFLLGIIDFDTDGDSVREHFLTYLTLAPHGSRAPEARSRLSELAVRSARFARLAQEELSRDRGPQYNGASRAYPAGPREADWQNVRMPHANRNAKARRIK